MLFKLFNLNVNKSNGFRYYVCVFMCLYMRLSAFVYKDKEIATLDFFFFSVNENQLFKCYCFLCILSSLKLFCESDWVKFCKVRQHFESGIYEIVIVYP